MISLLVIINFNKQKEYKYETSIFDVIIKILISEKEFTETYYKWFQEGLVCILIDTNGGMCLTVQTLIETNNIIAGSNNVTLAKFNVKPHRFDKIYMGIRVNRGLALSNNRSREEKLHLKTFIEHS